MLKCYILKNNREMVTKYRQLIALFGNLKAKFGFQNKMNEAYHLFFTFFCL